MELGDEIKAIKERLNRVEEVIFGDRGSGIVLKKKAQSLPELLRNRKPKNGQQKVALIVGHCELVQRINEINEHIILQTWCAAKFNGSYANTFLHRAIGDGLISDKGDSNYELTQTGQTLFKEFSAMSE